MKAHIRVLSYIPVGRDNPIRRIDLKRMLGIPDRIMRDLITTLRAQGWPILNNQDGRGYYIADNEADIERFRRQELTRACQIIKTAYKIRYIDHVERVRRKLVARAA